MKYMYCEAETLHCLLGSKFRPISRHIQVQQGFGEKQESDFAYLSFFYLCKAVDLKVVQGLS